MNSDLRDLERRISADGRVRRLDPREYSRLGRVLEVDIVDASTIGEVAVELNAKLELDWQGRSPDALDDRLDEFSGAIKQCDDPYDAVVIRFDRPSLDAKLAGRSFGEWLLEIMRGSDRWYANQLPGGRAAILVATTET